MYASEIYMYNANHGNVDYFMTEESTSPTKM